MCWIFQFVRHSRKFSSFAKLHLKSLCTVFCLTFLSHNGASFLLAFPIFLQLFVLIWFLFSVCLVCSFVLHIFAKWSWIFCWTFCMTFHVQGIHNLLQKLPACSPLEQILSVVLYNIAFTTSDLPPFLWTQELQDFFCFYLKWSQPHLQYNMFVLHCNF